MAAGTRQLVVFVLGREEYALPIETVQEVIRWSEPRSIGAAEPWLLGVVSANTLGGFIHVLLVVAIGVVLIRIIQGRRPV